MTIDLDKLSNDAASAVLDVIEEERRINKDDIREAIKKAAKPHLDKMVSPPGGFGVGTFLTFGDAILRADDCDKTPGAITWIDGAASDRLSDIMKVNVGKWFRIDHPLLPDED